MSRDDRRARAGGRGCGSALTLKTSLFFSNFLRKKATLNFADMHSHIILSSWRIVRTRASVDGTT
jgi:hypothetical protein